MAKAKLGSGKRFRTVTRSVAGKGVRNPKALAASIGRKKYGNAKMAKLSAQGRKRAAAKRKG